MFPGSRDQQLANMNNYKYGKNEYCKDEDKGVWFSHAPINVTDLRSGQNVGNNQNHAVNLVGTSGTTQSIQGGNQYIYFRIKDVHGTEEYYDDDNTDTSLSWVKSQYKYTADEAPGSTCMYLYPSLGDRYDLCLDTDIKGAYILLTPGDEIIVPIMVEYYVANGESINKTMAFDILPSLYQDPIPYTFTVVAKWEDDTLDKVTKSNKSYLRKLNNSKLIRYNTKIK
jgi:hypothetical protein